MTAERELVTLARELDSFVTAHKRLAAHRCLAPIPAIENTFRRLASVDVEFALEMLWVDSRLGWICREHIPDLVASLGDTPQAFSFVGRTRSLFTWTAEKDLVSIAEAAEDGSLLRQFALDEALGIAINLSDPYKLALFCIFQLRRIRSLSPLHASKLVELTANALTGTTIKESNHHELVRGLLAVLTDDDLSLPPFGELGEKIRNTKEFWEIEKEFRRLGARLERFESLMTAAPKDDKGFAWILECLKDKSIWVWDERTRDFKKGPASQGNKVCVADGYGVDFVDGFYDPLEALMELLWPGDDYDDEVDLDWSGCNFVLMPDFPEYVSDIVANFGSFEDCLYTNELAELEIEDLPTESPEENATWFQVWVDQDLVVPILKELWGAARYAAEIVLPRHQETLRQGIEKCKDLSIKLGLKEEQQTERESPNTPTTR